MNNKILIISQLNGKFGHPRIDLERKVLSELGYNVQLKYSDLLKGQMSFMYKLKYWLTLSFFRWDIINELRKIENDYFAIIIYDFALLPSAKFLKNRTQKLIYETLDDNVSLTLYNLGKKFFLINTFSKRLKKYFFNIEKKLIAGHIDSVIVNSLYLKGLFNLPTKLRVNYYASPFELLDQKNALNKGLNPAILYLGKFSFEKGAHEILILAKRFNMPLFIFGDIEYKFQCDETIFVFQKTDIKTVYDILLQYSKNYRFLGTSLIKEVNDSYTNQEANKDIDYLALGIPIIGNKRAMTYEKILSHCGVLWNDTLNVEKLLYDVKFYEIVSLNCQMYYKNKYSIFEFKRCLSEILSTDKMALI